MVESLLKLRSMAALQSCALRDLVKVEDQGVREMISVYCEKPVFS